jgi:hypothetical protein
MRDVVINGDLRKVGTAHLQQGSNADEQHGRQHLKLVGRQVPQQPAHQMRIIGLVDGLFFVVLGHERRELLKGEVGMPLSTVTPNKANSGKSKHSMGASWAVLTGLSASENACFGDCGKEAVLQVRLCEAVSTKARGDAGCGRTQRASAAGVSAPLALPR